MPRKKIEKKRVNKSAFVRGLPAGMPVAEVVAAAKKEGIKLSTAYVYNIRASAKNGKKSNKNKVNGSKHSGAAAVSTSDDTLFMEMAVNIGLSRSLDLLGGLQERIKAALA